MVAATIGAVAAAMALALALLIGVPTIIIGAMMITRLMRP
jgi:hypothetical protein